MTDYDWFVAYCKERTETANLRKILGKLQWKSIDRDNMEFQCTTTCYVMDEIRAALEETK